MARAEKGGCARRLRRYTRIAGWWAHIPAKWTLLLPIGTHTHPGRTERRAAWLFALPILATSGSLAAQTADQAQQAAQDAIRRLDLQTELPHATPPSAPWHLDLPPDLLWVVVAIALGILLYAFRDLIPAWRASAGAPVDEGEREGETAAGTPAVILEAADELAARGRFMEAMHMLLLHGLAHIRQRLDLQFSDSLTSREILRNKDLPDAARSSLRDVVARVELTYFGLQPAGADDYAACRESFYALESALYRGAVA